MKAPASLRLHLQAQRLNFRWYTPILPCQRVRITLLVCASTEKSHLKGTGAQGRRRHGGRTRSTRIHGQGGAIGSATEDPLPPIPPFQPTPYNAPPVQPNPYDGTLPLPVPIAHAVTPVTQADILPDPGSAHYPYSMPTIPSAAFGAGVSESESNPLSAVHVVDERLRAVSEMIQVVAVINGIRYNANAVRQTKGSNTDLLEKRRERQSGSRLPAQEHLRAFGDSLYARAQVSHRSSRNGSIAGSLQSDSFTSTFNSSQNVSEASKKRDPSSWGYYSEAHQELLVEVRVHLLHEMATSVGWPIPSERGTGRKQWSPVIREILSQLCTPDRRLSFIL